MYNTVPEAHKPVNCSELDKLLSISEGQHGFWLVNHLEAIEKDLTELLDNFGLVITAGILNEIDNPITKNIYKKINIYRKEAKTL